MSLKLVATSEFVSPDEVVDAVDVDAYEAELKAQLAARPPHWKDFLQYDNQDRIVNNSANLTKIVRHHPDIRPRLSHDLLKSSDRYQTDEGIKVPFQNIHYSHILHFIQDECDVPKANIHDVRRAVDVVLRESSYQPDHVYFNSLKWDGTERIDTMLIDLGNAEDTPATRMFTRKFMIGLVQRSLYPGCFCKRSLILLGDQNLRKSGFLRCLLPDRSWYSDEIHDITASNNALHLEGKLLVEIAENAVRGNKDRNLLKAFLSRDSDLYRAPYEKQAVDHLRRSVFCITSNDDTVFNDPTGSSRFMPIRLSGFLMPDGKVRIRTEDIDGMRDQLFAEAVHYVRQGETNELPAEFEAIADALNKELDAYDEWTPEVHAYIENNDTATLKEIRTVLVDTNGVTQTQAYERIKNILIKAGWEKKIVNGQQFYRQKDSKAVPEKKTTTKLIEQVRSKSKGQTK